MLSKRHGPAHSNQVFKWVSFLAMGIAVRASPDHVLETFGAAVCQPDNVLSRGYAPPKRFFRTVGERDYAKVFTGARFIHATPEPHFTAAIDAVIGFNGGLGHGHAAPPF